MQSTIAIITCMANIHADIDECVPTSPCDEVARCVNTVGSFICECPDGYTRNADGLNCTGEYNNVTYACIWWEVTV